MGSPVALTVAVAAANDERNRRVALVVDDSKMQRLIHKTMLKSLGVDTQEAENGKKAVDICFAGARFDLILMDNDMPIMDGPKATRELRDMGICCKIVGVSARSREMEKQSFIEAGLDDYEEKPLTRAKLVSILEELENKD